MSIKIHYFRLRELNRPSSTYYAQVSAGLMPPPVKLGPRTSGVPQHEIEICNEAQLAGLSNDEQRELVRKLVEARREFLFGRGDTAIARIREKFEFSGEE